MINRNCQGLMLLSTTAWAKSCGTLVRINQCETSVAPMMIRIIMEVRSTADVVSRGTCVQRG